MNLYTSPVTIGPFTVSPGKPFFFIGGPCVIESREHALFMAEALKAVTHELGIPFIFKASYDKANRSSLKSFRGPGLAKGLDILGEIRDLVGIPVTTDVHECAQAEAAGKVVDLLQVPAFLCRQTDLLIAAAASGKPVSVKKGQFLSPEETRNIVEKVRESGSGGVLLIERGFSFGYNNLIVDFRGLPIMRQWAPVIFDATHSVQLPGGQGTSSGGKREFIPYLTRSAVAAGLDGLFMEVHDNPVHAKSDGPNQVPLKALPHLLKQLRDLDAFCKANPPADLEAHQ